MRAVPEEFDDDFDDDEDDDELLRQWQEAEQQAVATLREALGGSVGAAAPDTAVAAAADRIRAGVKDRAWPYRHIADAAGWSGQPPAKDQQCCVEAAGALIGMREDSGLDVEQSSLIMAIDPAAWLGAVIGLVRAGPGARADAGDLVGYLDACPEVEGELDDDDADLVQSAFELILHTWEATGVVDARHRLTGLGSWVVPRALAWAWHGDFDAQG